ncbi:MAG: DUF1499 domain-containing protein [Pseudomonadota bacterium]
MRFIVLTIVIGALLLGAIAVYMIRTVRHTPIERWHVDPMTAVNPPSPNFYRIGPRDRQSAPVDDEAPIYGVVTEELARALDDFALRQRDTLRIAGTPASLWMTYVQRTPQLKFPDYISVRVIALEDGRSTLSVFSRARFGYGDMGVNRMRVESWLRALEPLEFVDPVQPDADTDGLVPPGFAEPDASMQDQNGIGDANAPTPVASPPDERPDIANPERPEDAIEDAIEGPVDIPARPPSAPRDGTPSQDPIIE